MAARQHAHGASLMPSRSLRALWEWLGLEQPKQSCNPTLGARGKRCASHGFYCVTVPSLTAM